MPSFDRGMLLEVTLELSGRPVRAMRFAPAFKPRTQCTRTMLVQSESTKFDQIAQSCGRAWAVGQQERVSVCLHVLLTEPCTKTTETLSVWGLPRKTHSPDGSISPPNVLDQPLEEQT